MDTHEKKQSELQHLHNEARWVAKTGRPFRQIWCRAMSKFAAILPTILRSKFSRTLASMGRWDSYLTPASGGRLGAAAAPGRQPVFVAQYSEVYSSSRRRCAITQLGASGARLTASSRALRGLMALAAKDKQPQSKCALPPGLETRKGYGTSDGTRTLPENNRRKARSFSGTMQ